MSFYLYAVNQSRAEDRDGRGMAEASASGAARSYLNPWMVFIPAGIAVFVVFYFFDPSLFGFFPKCLWQQATGTHCPGCGSQRALHDLFTGRIGAAFSHNPLLLTLGPVAFYWMALDSGVKIFPNSRLARIYREGQAARVIFVIVVGFWILRNLPLAAFSWMAP